MSEETAIQIYTPEDCYDKMMNAYHTKKDRGTTTYNSEMDECWTWRRKEFNIWTGYANESKSTMLKQVSAKKALEENKKFIFCSPEDFPPDEFFDDMIHTIAGKQTDREYEKSPFFISKEEYDHVFNQIKNMFYFLYIKPPNNSIEQVLEQMKCIIDSDPDVYGCILDPLLKFQKSKKAPDRDDQYASYIGSIMVDFARETNTSTHLVMHQLTPRIDVSSGCYTKPNMYNIKGGGSWADGADNILYVWRPQYALNKKDTSVTFGSQKIKKQKLVGIPNEFDMTFDRKTNTYTDLKGKPVFDFSKFRL